MIDEAIGKILGMAMAYLASAMGMFVAYVNYRKRIVKADTVMTGTAWAVIGVTVLATICGVVMVGQLAAGRTVVETPAFVEVVEEVAEAVISPQEKARREAAAAAAPERSSWSWIGILVPAVIFLFATVVTAGLHRHFSTHGH